MRLSLATTSVPKTNMHSVSHSRGRNTMEAVEILLEEYKALRLEITQSIAKQHWIIVGGYALAGTVIIESIQKQPEDPVWINAVPLAFVSTISLWLVEANRMVRASYFIAYVQWQQLKSLADGKLSNYNGWEHWIRADSKSGNRFRLLQDIFQRIAVIVIPAIISVLSAVYSATLHYRPLLTPMILALTFFAFPALFFIAGLVSNLAAIQDDSKHSVTLSKLANSLHDD